MTGPGEVFGTCYHGDLAGKGRKLWLEARHGLRRHSRRRWLWWWEQADKLALSEMTRSSKPNLHQHNQAFNHFLSAQTLWEGVTAGGTEQASLPFFTSACWTRSVFVSVRWRKGNRESRILRFAGWRASERASCPCTHLCLPTLK